MRNRSSLTYAATAGIAALAVVLVPTLGKADTITQTVTLLSPGVLGAVATGPGSTSFDQFDPALGTLNAVSFAIVGPPGTFISTTFAAYTAGTSTFIQYDLYTPNFSTRLFGKSVTIAGIGSTGEFGGLLATVDTTLSQYIGPGDLSLIQFHPHNNVALVNVGGFTISSDGRSLTPRSPDINITYDYTPAAAPVPGPIAGAGFPGIILAVGGLIWWRRRPGRTPMPS